MTKNNKYIFFIAIQEKAIEWWEVNAIITIMRSDLLNSNAILDKKKLF